MNTVPPSADHVADALLPLDGPYRPDRVIEAARTIGELVRRLNHATRHRSALPDPAQVYETVGALRGATYGLEQTLEQLADRLDRFARDAQVGHNRDQYPAVACAQAAAQLRQAAATLAAAAAPLNEAHAATSHLYYETPQPPQTAPADASQLVRQLPAPSPSPMSSPGPSGRSR